MMFEISNRVKKIIVIAACIIAIPLLIDIFIDVRYHVYYHFRLLDPLRNKNFLPFIKQDSVKGIVINKSFGNSIGDTIYYCTIRPDRRLVVLKRKKYNAIPLSEIRFLNDDKAGFSNKDISQKIPIGDDLYPFITVVIKPELEPALNLNFYLKETTEDTIVVTASYIYYALNFKSIIARANGGFNFVLTKFPGSPKANFMVNNYKGEFYLSLLCSGDSDEVKPTELLRVLKP